MKALYRLFVSSLAISSWVVAFCNSTIADTLNSRGSITIVQPEAMNDRLKPSVRQDLQDRSDSDIITDSATPKKIRAGYRVQVFDDNNVRSAQHDAQRRKQQIANRFPDFPVYVTFSSPYWRVKVGDFRTRGEAEAAMAEIRHAFPEMAKSLRIVRDRINQ